MQPPTNKWLAPIQPPVIDRHLEELGSIERTTICLRFFVLSTEHWLSPGGRLRWWLKLNCTLGAGLLIPAVFLAPIITLVLHEVDGWLSLVVSIVLKLILLTSVVSVVICASKHRKYFSSPSVGSSRRLT